MVRRVWIVTENRRSIKTQESRLPIVCVAANVCLRLIMPEAVIGSERRVASGDMTKPMKGIIAGTPGKDHSELVRLVRVHRSGRCRMKRPYKVDVATNAGWSRFVLSGLIGTSLVGIPALTSGCKTGAKNQETMSSGPVGTFPQSAYEEPQLRNKPVMPEGEPQFLEPLPPSGGHSTPWATEQPAVPAVPMLPPPPAFDTSVPEEAKADVENDLIAQRRSIPLREALPSKSLVTLGAIEPMTDVVNVAQKDESLPTWGMVAPNLEQPKLLKVSASEPKLITP